MTFEHTSSYDSPASGAGTCNRLLAHGEAWMYGQLPMTAAYEDRVGEAIYERRMEPDS
jgi:hypothetical protein